MKWNKTLKLCSKKKNVFQLCIVNTTLTDPEGVRPTKLKNIRNFDNPTRNIYNV